MTPEKEAYLNHLMGSRCCHAPIHRYCELGLQLKLSSDARFIADLKDIHERRRWMQSLVARMPEHKAELEALVRRKFEERKA